MLEEPRIVARSCAARVDQRRAPASSETERIDPKRRAAPIDMSMQVDEAGRDDEAANVPDLRAGKSRADCGDAAILEADVRDRVETL